jgi:2,4-dienoyl-CoA reductase-like NADH-dependent reductase (Old Yellow Enzyme family)
MMLENLFSPGKIGNVQIKNRIIRSATSENMASKDGQVSDQLIKVYTELARGGTGLITTGGLAVHPSSTLNRYAPCLYDDAFLPGQKKLVEAVHDYSECRIAAQLVHTGRQTGNRKYQPVAPSPIPDKIVNRVPRELKTEEIADVINMTQNNSMLLMVTSSVILFLHIQTNEQMNTVAMPKDGQKFWLKFTINLGMRSGKSFRSL